MIMKDKLYKTYHKGLYYKTRKFLIGSAVVLSAFTAVFVPTYINLKQAKKANVEKLCEHLEKDESEHSIKDRVKEEAEVLQESYVLSDISKVYNIKVDNFDDLSLA